METSAPEETKVGLMLSQGFTTKEVANITGKSLHTVSQQKRRLYEKTGSHNLADLTRAMINRVAGVKTEDLIATALKNLVLVALIIAAYYSIKNPEILETLKSSLINILSK